MKLSVLEDIASDQKEMMLRIDKGLQRDALETLPTLKTHVLIISGIRRCGKSTLLNQYLQRMRQDFFYLNFENIRLYDFQMRDFST